MTDLNANTRFLDHYVLQGTLGSGGMATVYKAVDTSLDRAVAIKVVHRELAPSPELLGRFTREAKIMAALDHPGIARVFRYGLIDDQQPFIIMEYIQGQSLTSLLAERTSLPWSQAVDIGIQLSDAMQYAHANGVVHRDLTPNNILICPSGGEKLETKIVDFGLGSLTAACQSKLTADGHVVGTAQYMSPEQCQARPTDGRSDIYALGCTLYECIAGKTVFDGDSILTLLFQHVQERPRPLTEHESARDCPTALNELVLKCLSKEPDNRYQSMQSLKEELELVLSGNDCVVALSGKQRQTRAGEATLQLFKSKLFVGVVALNLAMLLAIAASPESLLSEAFVVTAEILPTPNDIRFFQNLSIQAHRFGRDNVAMAAASTAYKCMVRRPQNTWADCTFLILYQHLLQQVDHYYDASEVATTYLACLCNYLTKMDDTVCVVKKIPGKVGDEALASHIAVAHQSIILAPRAIPYSEFLDAAHISLACPRDTYPFSALAINLLRMQVARDHIQKAPYLAAGLAALRLRQYDRAYYYLLLALSMCVGTTPFETDSSSNIWTGLLDPELVRRHAPHLCELAIKNNLDTMLLAQGNVPAVSNLATLYYLTHHWDRSEKLIKALRRQQGGQLAPSTVTTLAQDLLFQGKVDECRQLLKTSDPITHRGLEYWRRQAVDVELDFAGGSIASGQEKLNHCRTTILKHVLNLPACRNWYTEVTEYLLYSKHYSEVESMVRFWMSKTRDQRHLHATSQSQLAEALYALADYEGAGQVAFASIGAADTDQQRQRALLVATKLAQRSGNLKEARVYSELARAVNIAD